MRQMEVCPSCGVPAPHNGACPGSHAQVPGPKSRGLGQQMMRPADFYTGRLLQNRYEIVDLIGQGGMGTVYMARDLRLKGRGCVVKKLRDDFYREEDRQQA